MNMRKVLVWAITFAVVIVAYLCYNRIFNTPDIVFQEADQAGKDIVVPDFDEGSASIDGVRIGTVKNTRFVTLDEKTKMVKRVFGFDELLNPDEGTERWKLRKPYMDIFDKEFRCKIRSARGTAQVETVAGKHDIQSAQLIDNVIIKIRSGDADNRINVDIYLDDLDYYSERSEFSTEGPVKLISDNGWMEGVGMVLIYNPELNRIEYLEITDLDYIYAMNVSGNSSEMMEPATHPSAGAGSREKQASGKPSGPAKPARQPGTDKAVAEVQKADPDDTGESEEYYYRCLFSKNVVVKYGRELTVEGAEELVINNILLSDRAKTTPKGESQQAPDKSSVPGPSGEGKDKTVTTALTGSPPETNGPEAELIGEPDISVKRYVVCPSDDEIGIDDAVITCDGGVIIKPTDSTIGPSDSVAMRPCTVEFIGSPVRVKEVSFDTGESSTVARCGVLKYDLATDVVDMLTNMDEKYIVLNMADSETGIYTTGSVKWQRQLNKAVIIGPGRMITQQNPDLMAAGSSGKKSEMKFNGVMDLFFADSLTGDPVNAMTLRSVNLAGGMTASLDGDDPSYMAADSGTFSFGENNDITEANLKGNVDFNSKSGRLTSQKAKITFARDDTGKTYAKTIQSTENPVLTPKMAKDTEYPTRFNAEKIDYDILTGDAFATGPVEFTFYSELDTDPNSPTEPVPIVITADGSAQFFAKQNRVVFNENVSGKMEVDKPEYKQLSTMLGETMTVDLIDIVRKGPRSQVKDSKDIGHITVSGGSPSLHTIRSVDDEVISNVLLECRQIDYEAADKWVVATGPGSIELNNENAPVPPEDTEETGKKLKLEGPCYAIVGDKKGRAGLFNKLRWDMAANRIIAEGEPGGLFIAHVPLVDGKPGQITNVTATHIEATFIKTLSGRSELDSLTAKDGIVYEEIGGNRFIGQNLFFDAQKSLMIVTGTPDKPCSANGVRVPMVEYDLESGKIKTKLSATPGVISLPSREKSR